jgi:hypothetical protein
VFKVMIFKKFSNQNEPYDSTVGLGIKLQARRPWVLFLVMLLDFLVHLILPAAAPGLENRDYSSGDLVR